MEISKLLIDFAVITLLVSGMYVTKSAYERTASKLEKAYKLFMFSVYTLFLWIYVYATIGIDLANVIARS